MTTLLEFETGNRNDSPDPDDGQPRNDMIDPCAHLRAPEALSPKRGSHRVTEQRPAVRELATRLLLCLALLLLAGLACDDQTRASEEDALDLAADSDDDTGDAVDPGDGIDDVDPGDGIDAGDGAVDMPADSNEDTDALVDMDEDVPQDVDVADMGGDCTSDDDCSGESMGCWEGECISHCDPPLRIVPSSGPDTGRTRIHARGQMFYIGALDWWATFEGGSVVSASVYDGGSPAVCQLSFYSPPLSAGDYPTWVYYGGPMLDPPIPPDPDPGMMGGVAGTWESVTSTETMGSGGCTSDMDCPAENEVCELGVGRCVLDICRQIRCEETWGPGGSCEQAMGCVPEALQCETTADCELIYSSCGCQAVHVDDPREALTSCGLGACETCFANQCELNGVTAACVDGICVEQ